MIIEITQVNPDGVLLSIKDIHMDTYEEAFEVIKAVDKLYSKSMIR